MRRDMLLRHLVEIQYERNDIGLEARHVPRARRYAGGDAGLRRDGATASRCSATRSSASSSSTR